MEQDEGLLGSHLASVDIEVCHLSEKHTPIDRHADTSEIDIKDCTVYRMIRTSIKQIRGRFRGFTGDGYAR